MNRQPQDRTDAGFHALELVVAVAVMVALAAVVVPVSRGSSGRDRVGQVIETVDSLRAGSLRFQKDVGSCPREYSSSELADNHQLSLPQSGLKGWSGPYIDHPLDGSSSPFGGFVNLYSGLDHSLYSGFDLEGRGQRVTGPGTFLRYSECSESSAHRIDQALDRGVAGAWTRGGRVQWRDGRLDIFLHAAGR